MAKETSNIIVVNPLIEGVTYEFFLNSIPKSVTVKDYLKNILNDEEINWIEIEIENYKNNNIKTK